MENSEAVHDPIPPSATATRSAGFRVGSVRFLNAVPLTRGMEDETVFATPSQLAAMLQRDELDAALVSVTEPLFNDRYDILDGFGVVSHGPVASVFLAHRGAIEAVREVYCDTASLTSVNLVRVLLAERGLRPAFKPLAGYDFSRLPDYTLLIGDNALDFARTAHAHQIWDLGQAWWDLTGLPFVYAVWALRRGIDHSGIQRRLAAAGRLGMAEIGQIIQERTDYDPAFCAAYFTRNIQYPLGPAEKRGLAEFVRLLRRHGTAPVFDPRFVGDSPAGAV